jgi:transcriptional regulator with XRE-family HTH domain
MAIGRKHKHNEEAILTLAKNIRKYRTLKNYTIEELANIVEVDYSQISRMERGTVNASVSIIFDIASALQIEASKLLEKE